MPRSGFLLNPLLFEGAKDHSKVEPMISHSHRAGRSYCSLEAPRKEEDLMDNSPTWHSGYCSATSAAQAPEPDPHSKILRGRGIGGNINRLSNIMLNTACIYWRRSISSWFGSVNSTGRWTLDRLIGKSLHRQQGRSTPRFPRRSAGIPCHEEPPPRGMSGRQEWSASHYTRLSNSLLLRICEVSGTNTLRPWKPPKFLEAC